MITLKEILFGLYKLLQVLKLKASYFIEEYLWYTRYTFKRVEKNNQEVKKKKQCRDYSKSKPYQSDSRALLRAII